MKISNEPITLDEVPIPVYASPKLDGVYCMVYEGRYYSRTLKPIPNLHLRAYFHDLTIRSEVCDQVFFGELIGNTFSHTNSLVRSRKTRLSGLRFGLFDYTDRLHFNRCSGYKPFNTRYEELRSITSGFAGKANSTRPGEPIFIIPHRIIKSTGQLRRYYNLCVNLGFEGIVAKNPDSYYKHGRTTKRKFNQAKFRHTSSISGHILKVHNQRVMLDDVERTTTADGYLEKINTKGSFSPTQLLGSFTVKFEDGRIGKVGLGKGYNKAERRRLWQERENLIGIECEVEYLVSSNKDLPRQPKVSKIREDLI